jgi:hypothetical protein
MFTLNLKRNALALVEDETSELMLGGQAEQEWPKPDALHNPPYKEPIPPHAMSLS